MGDVMSVSLRSSDGKGGFSHLELKGEEVWLGRGADCALRTDHLTVSNRHCRLYRKDGAWFLCNESRNGTYLNEREVTNPVVLKDGDVITCGKLRGLVAVFVSAAAKPTSQPEPAPRRPAATDGPAAPAPAAVPPEPKSPARAEPPPVAAPAAQGELEALVHKLGEALRERDMALQQAAAGRAELLQAQAMLRDREDLLAEAATVRQRDEKEAEELRKRIHELDALQLERLQESIRAEERATDRKRRADKAEDSLNLAVQRLTVTEGEREKARKDLQSGQELIRERDQRIRTLEKDAATMLQQRNQAVAEQLRSEQTLATAIREHNRRAEDLNSLEAERADLFRRNQNLATELRALERQLKLGKQITGELPGLGDVESRNREARLQAQLRQRELQLQAAGALAEDCADRLAELKGNLECALSPGEQRGDYVPGVRESLTQCATLNRELRQRLGDPPVPLSSVEGSKP